jgi:2-amino-4-hydroxy-6-hydroxymethyldihydropteridine diphosphokinase
MARCLIGCGSNLGDRHAQLGQALELLRFMPGVEVLAVSRYRETRPVGGPPHQSLFLNGACLIETDLGPHDVLEMLTAIENTLHRERLDRWGERTIDLDLLLYDELVLDSPALTVPHPRMTTRRFVLEPAAEIAADLRHPLTGCTLAALLENLSAPHPHIAVIGVPGSGAPEVAVAVADALLARLVHAPVPLPAGRKRPAATDGLAETRWRNLLAAWAQPLEPEAWLDDPHGTVSDFWIGAVGLAAEEELDAAAHDRLRQQCDQAAARTVAPQVAIVLSASAEAIEERIAFRGRQAQPATNVFADLTPAAAAVCDSPADAVGGLLRLQRRLIERLTCPAQRPAGAPKAVVLIEADDLARAAADATAAVEAMV